MHGGRSTFVLTPDSGNSLFKRVSETQVALTSPYLCIPSPPMNELFSCPFTPVSTEFNSNVPSNN